MVTLDSIEAPSYAVVVMAKADARQNPAKERVMGVCALVPYLSPGEMPGPGAGGDLPNHWARDYFRVYEKRDAQLPSRVDVIVVEQPKHGKVVLGTNSANLELMQYIPDAGYVGSDRIVYSVSVEGKTVKLIYFVHVTKRHLDDVPVTDFCKANTWKISSSPDAGPDNLAVLIANASQSFAGFQN